MAKTRDCIFKIGDNVFIKFTGYDLEGFNGGNNIVLDSVYGSGPMFESYTEYELLNNDIDKNPDTYVSDRDGWANCWMNLAGSATTIFYNGKLLQCLDIPDGITSVTPGLFEIYYRYDPDVKENSTRNPIQVIRLGNTIKSIGYNAFKHEHRFGYEDGTDSLHLDKLEHVIFTSDEPLELLDRWAFEGCIKLTTVDFRGQTPKEFGESVFKDCFNLHSVFFGKNMNLNTHIFDNCVSLTSFNADNSLGEVLIDDNECLDTGLFNGCTSLNRFKFTSKSLFQEDISKGNFNRTMVVTNFLRDEPDKRYDNINQNVAQNKGAIDGYIKTLSKEKLDRILSNYNPIQGYVCEPFDIFLRQYILNYKLPTIIESENGGAYKYRWYSLENRHAVAKGGSPYLLIKHLDTLIRLEMYPYPYYNMPTDQEHRPKLFVKHKGNIWCLVTDSRDGSLGSPVHIKHNGYMKFIYYEIPD